MSKHICSYSDTFTSSISQQVIQGVNKLLEKTEYSILKNIKTVKPSMETSKIVKQYPNLEIQRNFDHFSLIKWIKPGNLTVADNFHIVPHYTELRQLPFVFKDQTKGLNTKWVFPIRQTSCVGHMTFDYAIGTYDLESTYFQDDSYVVFGNDFFYKLGANKYTRFQFGIVDCEVIQYTSEKSKDIFYDTCLVVRSDGCLFAISLNDNKSFHNNFDFTTCSEVEDSAYLGPGNNWKIIKNSMHSPEFAVANLDTGTIHFFSLTHKPNLVHLDTLQFQDAQILTCNWFNYTEPVLFIAILQNDRVLYHSLNWSHTKESTDNRDLNMTQLTNLHGELPNGSIPIGSDTILLFSSSKFQLVKSIQIKCGEPAPMFKFPALRGVNSWFHSNILKKKLNSTILTDKFPELSNLQCCTVICNSIGTIFCIVADSNEEIHYYCLGRFKGLKKISQASMKHSCSGPLNFNIVGLTFNRTVLITLDLKKMIKIEPIVKQPKINEIRAIVKSETLASTGNNYNQIVPTGFDNEIWLTSPSSVAQISTEPNIPFIKLENDYSSLLNVSILKNLQIVDGTILNHKIIWGLDKNDKPQIYQISPEYKLTNLIDFNDIDNLLYLRIVPNNQILKITKNQIEIISMGNQVKNKILCQCESNFDNFVYDEDRVIVWCLTDYSMWEIKDDCIIDLNFLKSLQNIVRKDEKITIKLERMNSAYREVLNVPLLIIDTSVMKHVFNLNAGQLYVVTPLPESIKAKNYRSFRNNDKYYYNFDTNNQLSIYFELYVSTEIRKFNFTLNIIKGQFFQIRDFKNKIIVFTLDKIYLLKSNEISQVIIGYELIIPIEQDKKSILDINFDSKDEKVYIINEDGLMITTPKYVTWNKYDHLLPNTRNLDKNFLYLKKINRMLIINNNLHEWYFMKLKSGKIIKLNSDLLKDEHIEDVVELNSSMHDNVSDSEDNGSVIIQLILLLKDKIKYAKLTIEENDITVTEKDNFTFNNELFKQIVLLDHKSFAILEIGIDIVNDRFIKYNIDSTNDKIFLENETIYPSKGEIIDWKVMNNTLMIVDAKGKFIITEDIFNDDVFDEDGNNTMETYIDKIYQKSSIIYDEYCFVKKICPINEKIFILVSDIDGDMYVQSEILFFHIDNFVTMKEIPFGRTPLIDSIVSMGNVSIFTYLDTVNQNKPINAYSLLRESRILPYENNSAGKITFHTLASLGNSKRANVLEPMPYYDPDNNDSLVGRDIENLNEYINPEEEQSIGQRRRFQKHTLQFKDDPERNFNFKDGRFKPFKNKPPQIWNKEYERIQIEYKIQDFTYSEGIIYFLTTDGTLLQFDCQEGTRDSRNGLGNNKIDLNSTLTKSIDKNFGYHIPRNTSIRMGKKLIDKFGTILGTLD